MYRRIIAKASVEVKRVAGEKFKACTETFKTEVATSPAEDTTADAFRLRGKRFLFSYSLDFFGKPLPDGTVLRSFGTLHARRNIYWMFFGLRAHVSKDYRQSVNGSQTRSGGEIESLHGNV